MAGDFDDLHGGSTAVRYPSVECVVRTCCGIRPCQVEVATVRYGLVSEKLDVLVHLPMRVLVNAAMGAVFRPELRWPRPLLGVVNGAPVEDPACR